MKEPKSWHIPSISVYNTPPPSQALHVLFLERLPEETRTRILAALQQGSTEWSPPFPAVPSTRQLLPVPWIRSYWPSSEVILQMTEEVGDDYPVRRRYRSFVLVDSGWDAETVVAARWEGGEGEGKKRKLVAARVRFGVANRLLTACDQGEVEGLLEGLGEAVYEESKVDFYKDLPTQGLGLRKKEAMWREWVPPTTFPSDLRMGKAKLQIVALRELDEASISSLKERILAGEEAQGTTVDIINWQGESPSRSVFPKIYSWIAGNTPAKDRLAYAFFVDSLLEDTDGRPQMMSVSHPDQCEKPLPTTQIELLPIQTDEVVAFWKAACTSAAATRIEGPTASLGVGKDTEINCGDIWRRERVIDVDHPIDYDGTAGDLQCCVVFFLRPYTLPEQRRIRAALSKQSELEDDEDWGKTFHFAGYIWPSGADETHSVEELRDVFEKCDPFSPAFDPAHSTLRLQSYPEHFVAVDDRIFDAEKPEVLLATAGLFARSNTLGWVYGVVPADEVIMDWMNFGIANMEPEELLNYGEEAPTKLWLSDVEAFVREEWVENEF